MYYKFTECEYEDFDRTVGLGYVELFSGFSEEQIDKIREYGDSQRFRPQGLPNQDVDHCVAPFDLTPETQWVYDHCAELAKTVNEEEYKFELDGFAKFHYNRYLAPSEYLGWHVDTDYRIEFHRKLTFVIQLSDPSEYEGGNLEIIRADKNRVMQKHKGMMCVFPSFHIHRVTPVTSGHRRTLTMFACGPAFK